MKVKYFRPCGSDSPAHVFMGISFALEQVSNEVAFLAKIHNPGFCHCPIFRGSSNVWLMGEECFFWKDIF